MHVTRQAILLFAWLSYESQNTVKESRSQKGRFGQSTMSKSALLAFDMHLLAEFQLG
jgi:hypothetical protein